MIDVLRDLTRHFLSPTTTVVRLSIDVNSACSWPSVCISCFCIWSSVLHSDRKLFSWLFRARAAIYARNPVLSSHGGYIAPTLSSRGGSVRLFPALLVFTFLLFSHMFLIPSMLKVLFCSSGATLLFKHCVSPERDICC